MMVASPRAERPENEGERESFTSIKKYKRKLFYLNGGTFACEEWWRSL
jgi:hypothetical protein